MLINGSFATGKTFRYKCIDPWGERTLVVPPSASLHVGDPTPVILCIESLNGIRIKDGSDPCLLIRVWRYFQKERDPAADISFAEYCKRLHADWIDVARKQLPARGSGVPSAGDDPLLSVEQLKALNHAVDPASRALAMLVKNPKQTVSSIASAVGLNRSTLYRNPQFRDARRIIRETEVIETDKRRRQVPAGAKDDQGNLDAWRD